MFTKKCNTFIYHDKLDIISSLISFVDFNSIKDFDSVISYFKLTISVDNQMIINEYRHN